MTQPAHRSKQQQAKHTPGPWTFETHELSQGFSSIVYDANGYRVGTDHLSEPDARLIAAAPELLAALNDVNRGDQFSDATICLEQAGHPELAKALRKYRDNARAIIAKAEGR